MRLRRATARALAVAASVVGAFGFAAVALAAASFTDPAGDNNAAPDVTSVTLSESADGMLSLTALVSNHQTLPTSSWFNLWFDLDLNQNTGDDGDEALVRVLDDGGLQFYRWDGARLTRQATTGMTSSFAAGTLTLTAPKTAFDNAAAFGMLVVGSRAQDLGDGDDLIAADFAPDRGRARYAAPGPFAFTDPTGDHDAAPDVTDVQVSDTRAGIVTFAIATPSHQTLPADTWLELDFDVDRRRSTGDGGVEVFVFVSEGQAFVGRWDASEEEFAPVRGSGVRVRNAAGVVTVDVPRGVLDDVASFDFYLISGDSEDEEEDNAIDLAPDGDAWWKYALVNKAPLRLIVGAPRGVPAQPRAGKRFAVVVPVRRSDTARGITSGSVACTVTVQGKRVRATGSVAAGLARCSLAVPAGARGTVRGAMVVRSGGKSVSARFAFAIR